MAKKTKAEATPAGDSLGVNLAEIERLLAFMQAQGLEEFEYQQGGTHIRLKKASAPAAMEPRTRAQGSAPSAAGGAEETPVGAPAAAASAAEKLHTIKSPIVGTFYGSPSPEADPFVKVGAAVESGQVLCIIEAMKLMNEIESDVAGEIVRIRAENGAPVEYGAPLFDIRPRADKKK